MQFYGIADRNLDTVMDLNRKSIEQALEKSPTGGNAKPFSWSWHGNALSIHHNPALAEHYLNPDNQASWIALGCLLTSVETAANDQGWKIEFYIREADVSAEITFMPLAKTNPSKIRTMAMLSRSTYRGEMKPSEAPTISSELCKAGTKVHLAAATSITAAFRKYMMASDTYLWLQTKATESFLKEVRFFDPRMEPRGIRSADLGIGKVDQMMFYTLKSMPWIFSILTRIPGINQPFKQASKRLLQNAHFCLITATDLTPASLVRAGQTAMATWLELEILGYSAQPSSIASLSLVAAENDQLPADTGSFFRDLFTVTGPPVLKQQFQLKPNEKPVWMLRFGVKKS